jgi:DNA-directed RNA polymerase specialized sigma24 family protein
VQRADVTAAMRLLSARDQEVLELHLWEGLDSREIAEVIGLTTAVVRPRLSRARSRLRELLGDDGCNDVEPPGHHLSDRPIELTRKER